MMASLNGGEVAGAKRKADESNLVDSDRFTKRFNLLSLGPHAHGSSNYYIPIAHPPPPSPPTAKQPLVRPYSDEELMQVDETPDRIYIHNLDDELADIAAEDERLIFLPDIEKHFSKIPQHVLGKARDDEHEGEGQELVLYSVPRSLTVEEGVDSVRKAILDARLRARQKFAAETRQLDMDRQYGQRREQDAVETAHGYTTGYVEELEDADEVADDPDVMDVD